MLNKSNAERDFDILDFQLQVDQNPWIDSQACSHDTLQLHIRSYCEFKRYHPRLTLHLVCSGLDPKEIWSVMRSKRPKVAAARPFVQCHRAYWGPLFDESAFTNELLSMMVPR
jgi:hypothetical protein